MGIMKKIFLEELLENNNKLLDYLVSETTLNNFFDIYSLKKEPKDIIKFITDIEIAILLSEDFSFDGNRYNLNLEFNHDLEYILNGEKDICAEPNEYELEPILDVQNESKLFYIF